MTFRVHPWAQAIVDVLQTSPVCAGWAHRIVDVANSDGLEITAEMSGASMLAMLSAGYNSRVFDDGVHFFTKPETQTTGVLIGIEEDQHFIQIHDTEF